DFPDIGIAVFEREGGCARYHSDSPNGGQCVDDLFGEAVAEISFGIRTQIRERENYDGTLSDSGGNRIRGGVLMRSFTKNRRIPSFGEIDHKSVSRPFRPVVFAQLGPQSRCVYPDDGGSS